MDTITSTATDIKASNAATMEAMTRSSQIWLSGFQEIARIMATMAQTQITASADMCKALGAVKTLPEAIEVHTANAHKCCSKAVDDLSTLATATLKLAERNLAQMPQHDQMTAR